MKPNSKFKVYLFLLAAFMLATTAMGIFESLVYVLPPIDHKLNAFLKEKNFQGSILVAKKGKILFSQGYGFANLEHGIPNSPQTVFRLGSVTKQFTAAAILQLQEKGKLNIHDPIAKYLPNYPHGNIITIHHLLSHGAGIPSITEFPNLAEIQRHPSTPHQVMTYFKDLPLKFTPGTDCEYSDSGYIVLGAIVELVSNQHYEDYLKENIFHPLGMTSTYYEHNHAVIPRRASGYMQEAENLKHPRFIDMSFPHGAGALASSVEDLHKWMKGLKEHTILSAESVNALFTIQASNLARKISYGYGFRVGPQNRAMEECDASIVGHFGTIEGFEAAIIHYRDEDLTLVLLSNVEKTDVRSFHKQIAQILRSSWRPSAA